jgi:hypothetical protein
MLVPIALISTTAAAEEPNKSKNHSDRPAIEVSSGVEYQEGDYGTGQKVRTLSAPAAVKISAGRLQLSATLPYRRVDAPANVVASGGLLGLPIILDPTKPAAGRTRREGIGDLTVGASYGIPSRLADLRLSGEVKLPTASRGLGTGKADYAVGADISKTVGRVTPFAGASYVMPGDPERYSLRNSLAFRGGVAAQIGSNAQGYIAYNHAQRISPQVPDDQRVTSGVDAAVSDRLSVGVYGAAGLSKGSPDVAAGLKLGIRLQ